MSHRLHEPLLTRICIVRSGSQKKERDRERGRRRVESELYHFVLSFSTGCGLPADLKQELRYYGRLHSHAPLNDMSDGKDKVHVSFFYPFNCKIFLNVQVL